jgi:hypothetical protein
VVSGYGGNRVSGINNLVEIEVGCRDQLDTEYLYLNSPF